MMLRQIGLALVLILVASSVVVAAPADDGYIEGYAAAVLQREFALAAPSLRGQQGVITIDAAEPARLPHPQRVRGGARVEVRPAGAPPPAVTPPPAPQPAPPAAQPPRLP